MKQPHHHSLRVYYEDTDAGGVVYHAAYVRFFDRARCEWLRSLGYEQRAITCQQSVLFAVRRLQLEYDLPAFLDDWLTVETRGEQTGRTRMRFTQQLRRDDTVLTTARVEVVCVSGNPFRPNPIPPALISALAE